MSARPGIVGAFILGAMGLAVGGILFFGGTRLFTRTLPAVAFFSESVAGLEVGAPVTFHGVRIGLVKKVTVEYSTAGTSARIPVVMEIQPEQITWEGGRRLTEDRTEFERLIRAGLRARLQMQSFVTGQLRVDLEFEPEVPARLTGASPDLPEIPTVPSELGQLWAELSKLRLHDLAESAQGAFASLDRVLRHVELGARSSCRQRKRCPCHRAPNISRGRRCDRSAERRGFDRAPGSGRPSRRCASTGGSRGALSSAACSTLPIERPARRRLLLHR